MWKPNEPEVPEQVGYRISYLGRSVQSHQGVGNSDHVNSVAGEAAGIDAHPTSGAIEVAIGTVVPDQFDGPVALIRVRGKMSVRLEKSSRDQGRSITTDEVSQSSPGKSSARAARGFRAEGPLSARSAAGSEVAEYSPSWQILFAD